MPSFRHKRTGKIVTVDSQDAFRFNNARYELVSDVVEVPEGTVAEVLAWVGDSPLRRVTALQAELAGKNRKGIIEALS